MPRSAQAAAQKARASLEPPPALSSLRFGVAAPRDPTATSATPTKSFGSRSSLSFAPPMDARTCLASVSIFWAVSKSAWRLAFSSNRLWMASSSPSPSPSSPSPSTPLSSFIRCWVRSLSAWRFWRFRNICSTLNLPSQLDLRFLAGAPWTPLAKLVVFFVVIKISFFNFEGFPFSADKPVGLDSTTSKGESRSRSSRSSDSDAIAHARLLLRLVLVHPDA